jgi:hypothetical protein
VLARGRFKFPPVGIAVVKLQVEHDQVRPARPRQLEPFGRLAGFVNPCPEPRQRRAEHFTRFIRFVND